MGEAKNRGTYDQRKEQAIAREAQAIAREAHKKDLLYVVHKRGASILKVMASVPDYTRVPRIRPNRPTKE